MPSVVAIIFFLFGFRTQRETARGQISERDHVRLRLRRSEGRGGLRAGAGVCSPRLPAGSASRRCAEPCNSAAKPQTSPPGKGRKTPAFFSKKGARRPAGAREAAPHHRPPGKVRMGPSGGGHLARLRASPTVTQTRGAGWGAGGGGGGGRPCTADEDLAGSVPRRAAWRLPKPGNAGPAHGPGAPLLGARPREETSLSGGETPLLLPAGGPRSSGARPCRGRAPPLARTRRPRGCDGERSPAQSSADTARHRTRRVRRTVGREGGEQQSARPGLGPARSGSRASNTTRSPL